MTLIEVIAASGDANSVRGGRTLVQHTVVLKHEMCFIKAVQGTEHLMLMQLEPMLVMHTVGARNE